MLNNSFLSWKEEDNWEDFMQKFSGLKGDLTLDLGGMLTFDNLKLGILVEILSVAHRDGREITVINLPNQARALLKMGKLDVK